MTDPEPLDFDANLQRFQDLLTEGRAAAREFAALLPNFALSDPALQRFLDSWAAASSIAITTVVEAALACDQDRLAEEKFLAVVAAVQKGTTFHEGSQAYISKALELVRSTLNQDPGEPSPRPN
jgi:hypothetical protein